MTNQRGARGLSLVEIIVVVAILSLVLLAVLASLPRRRETARRTSCQRNLMQIGVALILYDQATGRLPGVPELGTAASRETSPLKALLEQLGLPDLRDLTDPKNPPPRQPGFRVEEQRVPGFVCPSDPDATGPSFVAPVSYRATAGETPDGRNGAFSPGIPTSINQIEAGDGAGFTAAFSERLVGNNLPSTARMNYAVVPGPLPPDGCPASMASGWKGDAGSSWVSSQWKSTLYNHALVPNATPSCTTEDERSAFMGASSGHPTGVNVLFFDGSVKLYTPTVARNIWRALATPKSPARP